ncbi:MAG: hypothetical protein V7703_07275 [Hyphomicrobiales bacterium]
MSTSSNRNRRCVAALLSATALVGFHLGSALAEEPEMYGSYYHDWSDWYAGVGLSGHGSLASMDNTDFWEDNGYGVYANIARQGALGAGLAIYAGYNWQVLNRVFGLELNAEILSGHGESYFDVEDSYGWGRFQVQQKWLASLRGRAGITVDNTLAYLTAGVAAGSIEGGLYAPERYTKSIRSGEYFGHVIGFGVEHAVHKNVNLRLEGTWTRLYTNGIEREPDNDYGEDIDFKNTDDLAVTLGIAYQFGDGGNGGSSGMSMPTRDWSGFYAGLAVSGVASEASMDAIDFWEDNEYDSRDSYPLKQLALGAGGGVYAGYNMQRENLVYGLEATLDIFSAQSTSGIEVVDDYSYGEFVNRTRWVGSARGRFGLAQANTLLYLAGGVAFGEVEAGIRAFEKYTKATTNDVYLGVVGGLGVEQAVKMNGKDVILRAEGSWTRLLTGGNESFPDNDYGDEMDFDDTDIIAIKLGAALPF